MAVFCVVVLCFGVCGTVSALWFALVAYFGCIVCLLYIFNSLLLVVGCISLFAYIGYRILFSLRTYVVPLL